MSVLGLPFVVRFCKKEALRIVLGSEKALQVNEGEPSGYQCFLEWRFEKWVYVFIMITVNGRYAKGLSKSA